MSTKSLVITIVLVIAVLFGAYWVLGKKAPGAVPPGEITSFTVVRPNLVAEAKGLERVEVWAVPTGTSTQGNDESLDTKLGDMTNGQMEVNNPAQYWTLTIPTQPLSVAEIYAKGFDAAGNEYKKSLNVTGATDIYNTLWMTAPSTEAALKVGSSTKFEGLTLKLNKILEDSRCPKGVQCIQAGHVKTSITLSTETASTTKDLSSDDQGISFENYYVKIVNVSPDKTQGTPDYTKYEVTFSIEKDIKL